MNEWSKKFKAWTKVSQASRKDPENLEMSFMHLLKALSFGHWNLKWKWRRLCFWNCPISVKVVLYHLGLVGHHWDDAMSNFFTEFSCFIGVFNCCFICFRILWEKCSKFQNVWLRTCLHDFIWSYPWLNVHMLLIVLL